MQGVKEHIAIGKLPWAAAAESLPNSKQQALDASLIARSRNADICLCAVGHIYWKAKCCDH